MESLAAPATALRLRPGFPVLRRDQDDLQVGVRRPLATLLPDRPSVRRLLDDLEHARDPGPLDEDAQRALRRLAAAGLLIADRTASTDGPAEVRDGPPPSDLLLFGGDARRRAAARATTAVGVLAEPAARTGLDDLLAQAGLTVDEERAGVWLVATAGPARRGLLDPLVRTGVPHLLVAGGGPARRVGPFVVPGRTACVRCVDAHECEADPRLPFLIEQAAHPQRPGPPLDPLLSTLALAWAVRDLARFVEGDEPSTWSATVDIGPTAAPQVVRWLRHPECGCAWDTLLELP